MSERQLRQAVAQSLLGRGVGDEGQQRGSAGGQSVRGFLDRRGHLEDASHWLIPSKIMSAKLVLLTVLPPTPSLHHCVLTVSVPLLPRMISTGGRSAGITFSGGIAPLRAGETSPAQVGLMPLALPGPRAGAAAA